MIDWYLTCNTVVPLQSFTCLYLMLELVQEHLEIHLQKYSIRLVVFCLEECRPKNPRHFEVKLITRYLSFQQGSGALSSKAEVLYRQLLRGMCGILADKILGRKINLIGTCISVSYLLPCSLNRFL